MRQDSKPQFSMSVFKNARMVRAKLIWLFEIVHPHVEHFRPELNRPHDAECRPSRDALARGRLDHLIFYALQSTRITSLPPVEPALSAQGLVNALDDRERDVFLKTSEAPRSRIPVSARSRLAALLRAVDSSDHDPRLTYFRQLVDATFPIHREREAALLRDYLRVMRFVYEKEFLAQRSPRGPEAVAELYRTRGLSTDTAVEAGYLVSVGLGVVKSLEPDRRLHRVLIVGPGLDLAPRTGMLEQSRQAIIASVRGMLRPSAGQAL